MPTSPEAILLGKMAHHTKQIRRECTLYLALEEDQTDFNKRIQQTIDYSTAVRSSCNRALMPHEAIIQKKNLQHLQKETHRIMVFELSNNYQSIYLVFYN